MLRAVYLGDANRVVVAKTVGQFVPRRRQFLTVSAPRRIELDEMMPRRNVLLECIFR